MSPHFQLPVIIVLFALFSEFSFVSVDAWDQNELQMFDLVEELGMSFYEFLGVDKFASDSDIRRAYRQLSIKYHPDKNRDNPETSEKFRVLVGVYEVLKDKDLRASYDKVLEEGLPSWRTPVFYYRKLRKMSNFELFVMFVVLSTTIHYATLWGSRFERCWTLEEQLGIALKRQKARDRKREAIDLQIAEELKKVPRPKWHDLLPFAICKFVYAVMMCIPVAFYALESKLRSKLKDIQLHRIDSEEKLFREKAKSAKQERKRRVMEMKTADDCVYDITELTSFLSLSEMPPEPCDSAGGTDSTKTTQWTEEELVNLVRAVARFPGGVPNRWDRIASQLNRTVGEVTAKAKELGERGMNRVYCKTQLPEFEVNANAICGESSEESDTSSHDNRIDSKIGSQPSSHSTNSYNENDRGKPESDAVESAVFTIEPYVSRKKLKQQKLTSKIKGSSDYNASVDLSDGWTQTEQRHLEVAIRSIGKDVPERWDRIAECVPTKTKAEVMLRVKRLSNVIKAKADRSRNVPS